MIQSIAQALLAVYVLGFIPFFFMGIRGISKQSPVDNSAVHWIGSIVAVSMIMFTWPIIFVKAIQIQVQSHKRRALRGKNKTR